ARRLKPFDVRPKPIRIGADANHKGYELADFADAFRRYLPASENTATTATSATSSLEIVADDVVRGGYGPPQEAEAPSEFGFCVADVAVVAHLPETSANGQVALCRDCREPLLMARPDDSSGYCNKCRGYRRVAT